MTTKNQAAAETRALNALVGSWTGTVKTWLRPDELADESAVTGTIAVLFGDHLVRHTYEGSMNGARRTGEETIAFNPAAAQYQVSWFDTFHMSEGILFSEGTKTGRGFSVEGRYAAGPGLPSWRWRTEYEMAEADHLTITAFNIMPDGREGKAVETVYRRVK